VDVAPRQKLWPELREGLAYVLGHRYLRPLTFVTGGWNLFAFVGFGIYLVYLVRELELSPEVVGLLIMGGTSGSVVGALIASRVVARFGLGPTLAWSGLAASAAFVLVPLAPRDTPEPFILASMLLASFLGMLYNVSQLTFRQAITPERLQGRMNAVVRFMYWGPQPAGYVLGGVLAATIGLRPTLFVSAAGATLVFLPLLVHPIRKLRDMPDRPDEPAVAQPVLADARVP
jgi:MFS family permease